MGTSIVNLEKLKDASAVLKAFFFEALTAASADDFPELALVERLGASALTVDCAVLGLDALPKVLGPEGRERVKLIFESYEKGYTKYTQTLDLFEDDVKVLDSKLPGWRSIVQRWVNGYIISQANQAGDVLANCKTLVCWDGQYLADDDHPSFYQGGAVQSNLLGYKFGLNAFKAALLAFQGLKNPFDGQSLYNKATHILYAPNIEFDVLQQVVAAVISGTTNVVVTKNIQPVLWRQFDDDQFALVDGRAGRVKPIIGVFDEELGYDTLEWDENDNDWFDFRKTSIGTLGKCGHHPGGWHNFFFSDGTAKHASD